MKRGSDLGTFNVWAYPALFAVLTLVGLFSALLGGGGIWWLISWLALAAPLLAIAMFLIKRRRP